MAAHIALNARYLWLSLGLLMCSAAVAEPPVSPAVESALLKEDWKGVVEKCAEEEQLASSPALRAIKAHACLALNRNNQSLLLFLSLANDKDRNMWLQWTTAFAEANPSAWIAHYLKGDALVRAGNRDAALECYSSALAVHGSAALVLNARGVLRAGKTAWKQERDGLEASKADWDGARADLEAACESGGQLADAYASLGNLKLMRGASKGAIKDYDEALRIAPGFALALNGRACAEFGLCKWSEANKDFAEAGRLLPLPLFVGNLRGLAVAAENLSNPGTETSPLFRFTDFLDWPTLRESTLKDGDVLRTLFEAALPHSLDGETIDALNRALARPAFYDQVKDRLVSGKLSDEMLKLIDQTRDVRRRGAAGGEEKERTLILLLNRLIVELSYPYLIAQHRQRDPGMQLCVQSGQLKHIDKVEYMRGLTDNQLLGGQNRVQNLWRPMADFVQGMPLVSPLGAQWNRHLDTANSAANIVAGERGLNLQTFRTGGVSTEMRRGFVDRGKWPVVSWFGLAQGAAGLEVSGPRK